MKTVPCAQYILGECGPLIFSRIPCVRLKGTVLAGYFSCYVNILVYIPPLFNTWITVFILTATEVKSLCVYVEHALFVWYYVYNVCQKLVA